MFPLVLLCSETRKDWIGNIRKHQESRLGDQLYDTCTSNTIASIARMALYNEVTRKLQTCTMRQGENSENDVRAAIGQDL